MAALRAENARLHTELDALMHRSRHDVSTLLSKLESMNVENLSLRKLLVATKNAADNAQGRDGQLSSQLHETQRTLRQTQEELSQSKSQHHGLVDRIQHLEGESKQHRIRVHSEKEATTRLRDQLTLASNLMESRSNELHATQEELARARKELLGKTRELSEVYAAYAEVVERMQHEERNEIALKQQQQQHQQQEPTPTSPLSQQLQLDLHRSLATLSQESAQLRRRNAELETSLAKALNDVNNSRIGRELQMLRSQMQRMNEDKIKLEEDKKQLEQLLAQRTQEVNTIAAATRKDAITSPTSSTASASSSSPSPSSSSPASHSSSIPSSNLYKQIVELSEEIVSLKRLIQQRDERIHSLESQEKTQKVTMTHLEKQVDQLSNHLRQFQQRDLPSMEEAEEERRKRQQEFDEHMEELRRKEEAWRKKMMEERKMMMQKQSTQESFILKAIAIHCEDAQSEVDSLHALLSSKLSGLEPSIEHLVPKSKRHTSKLDLQQTEGVIQQVVEDLRSLRRIVADEYAKGLGNECLTQ